MLTKFILVYSIILATNLMAGPGGDKLYPGKIHCSKDLILNDEKITPKEIKECSLSSITSAIPFWVSKKYYGPKFNNLSFNSDLKAVKDNFSIIHFIPNNILDIVLNGKKDAGKIKNFLEIDSTPSAQVLASHANKSSRVQAEIHLTKLKYFPNPISENLTEKKVDHIFPKYARPIYCKKPFYIRLNFGDIGLIISPLRFHNITITEKGNLKTGKLSGPLTVLNRMINMDKFYQIYEAQIWGDFNVHEDVAGIIMPENYDNTITDPKSKAFINKFKQMKRVYYYRVSKLGSMKKFGDYEYDRVAKFINGNPCMIRN